MAAQASAMILYILWIVAVNWSIAPQVLTGFSGTALTPLTQVAGPAVNVFGVLLTIVAMGIAYMHFRRAVFFTVREWIPGQSRHSLVIERRQGKLLFTPRGKANTSLALTYLGLQGAQSQFRLDLQLDGDTRRVEMEVQTTWEAGAALAEFTPHLSPQTFQLALRIVSATAERVRVQLITPMRIVYEGIWDTLGFNFMEMAEAQDTPETPDMDVVRWLVGRRQASVLEVADFLGQSEQAYQTLLNTLVEQGNLLEAREQGQTWYTVRFAPRRRRQATRDIWQALDDAGEATMDKRDTDQRIKKSLRFKRMKELVQGENARSWLGLSPLLLIFLLVEWLLVNKLESFSQVVGFVGVIAVSVMAGVFPVLLLLASRRKGENVPGFVLPFLAHPLVVESIYLIAVSILFLHGLFIWQNAFQRVVAILIGVVILAMTYRMVRKATFTHRMVIEVRQDAEEGSGR